jgi:uncharacterized protein
MTAMLAGYALALGVGAVLGILGAGGATLTVPIFVYLFGASPKVATLLSLGVVGAVSLLGVVRASGKSEIRWDWAARAALPSFVTIWLSRKILLPMISPEREPFLMVAFALLLVLVARSMLRSGSARVRASIPVSRFVLRASGVGLVTGALGAGGGFLIVPMLTEWAALPFRVAASTSLAVILLNSAFGIWSGWSAELLPWAGTWLGFAGIAALGLVTGSRLASRIPADMLKRGFAWFLVGVSMLTLILECLR